MQLDVFLLSTLAPPPPLRYPRSSSLSTENESLCQSPPHPVSLACRRGLYPGHGHEIVEVTVARAHSGTASLPPELHRSYLQTGPHHWPLSPSTDQV